MRGATACELVRYAFGPAARAPFTLERFSATINVLRLPTLESSAAYCRALAARVDRELHFTGGAEVGGELLVTMRDHRRRRERMARGGNGGG